MTGEYRLTGLQKTYLDEERDKRLKEEWSVDPYLSMLNDFLRTRLVGEVDADGLVTFRPEEGVGE
jgi:hypothetical protein